MLSAERTKEEWKPASKTVFNMKPTGLLTSYQIKQQD
jgi:hypothetical protein